MPAIITRGAISARGFGFAAAATGCGPDGIKGIFALGQISGCPSTTRNKYTFATCTSTACGVAASNASSRYGAAAGNSLKGIFAIGDFSQTREKYVYSSCSNVSAGIPNTFDTLCFGTATGNSTRGIFNLGTSSISRCKYTYASCTSAKISASGDGSVYQRKGSAVGNCSIGIFSIGLNSSCRTNLRDKFTYASCTSASCGTGLASNPSSGQSAVGNNTRGIIALGCFGYPSCAQAVRNKYTYACNTSTCSGVGSASVKSTVGSAAGNSTRGIFALGLICPPGIPSTTRNKYTYASCTSTASGVGSASSSSLVGAAVSWAIGVNS
jgi:hypothetical protein